MDASTDLPDLLGSDALMRFLQDGLQQLEADQGFADDEARDLLCQLQQQTALMQALAGGQQAKEQLTDIQLAEQIDSVDTQLAQLEVALSAADAATKQLLGQSTSKWITSSPASSDIQQQRASTRQAVPSSSPANIKQTEQAVEAPPGTAAAAGEQLSSNTLSKQIDSTDYEHHVDSSSSRESSDAALAKMHGDQVRQQ